MAEQNDLTEFSKGELMNKVIASGDGRLIYELASKLRNEADTRKLEDALIKNNCTDYYYPFAEFVRGADKKRLADAVLQTNDAELVFNFAKFVHGVDIERLQEGVIRIGDPATIVAFARDIPDRVPQGMVDISKLQDAIIATRSAKHIYIFAMFVPGADIEKLQDALIETKDIEQLVKFGQFVQGADIRKLEDVLILSNDFKAMITWATDRRANVKVFEEAILASRDLGLYCDFAQQLGSRADVEKFQTLILNSKNPEYIARFATVKGANVEKLVDFVVEHGTWRELTYLKQNVQNCDLTKVDKALEEIRKETERAREKKREMKKLLKLELEKNYTN